MECVCSGWFVADSVDHDAKVLLPLTRLCICVLPVLGALLVLPSARLQWIELPYLGLLALGLHLRLCRVAPLDNLRLKVCLGKLSDDTAGLLQVLHLWLKLALLATQLLAIVADLLKHSVLQSLALRDLLPLSRRDLLWLE